MENLVTHASLDALATGKRERELVQIAGDAPDPTGTGPSGRATTYQLNRTAVAHPRIWYRDRVITADVYKHAGEPMMVHLICPRCRHALRITSDRKDISLDLTVPPPRSLLADLPPAEREGAIASGRIDVSAFECPWELPDAGEHEPGLVTGGMTLCRWKVGIEHNVARDA